MAIYLVQHGVSLSKEEDPERGLSAEGVEKVKLIGGVAANYGVQVNQIAHSGKKRALQTAEILAGLVQPAHGVVEQAGLAPMDDVEKFAKSLDPESGHMIVGHLPFMERLTSYLICGSTEHKPFKFQNGGIVCLDQEEGAGYWHIKWALMPNID